MTDNEVTGMQMPGDTPPSLPVARIVDERPSQNDDGMKNKAESLAEALIYRLKMRYGIRRVIVHAQLLRRDIEGEILNAISQLPPTNREERDRLKVVVGIPAYLKYFHDEAPKNLNIKGYLNDDREVVLCKFAIEDREKEQSRQRPSTDGRVMYHKRDLCVLRILDVYGITVRGAIENLERVHMLADTYERYYESEVVWPDDATFF